MDKIPLRMPGNRRSDHGRQMYKVLRSNLKASLCFCKEYIPSCLVVKLGSKEFDICKGRNEKTVHILRHRGGRSLLEEIDYCVVFVCLSGQFQSHDNYLGFNLLQRQMVVSIKWDIIIDFSLAPQFPVKISRLP